MQDKMQFVAHITFYPLSKFSRCKEWKSLLPLATQKLIEQVDGKAHRFSLCVLLSTRSTNFRVAKGRRDFHSLQREEGNMRNKLHLVLQRSLVGDKLQENIAR